VKTPGAYPRRKALALSSNSKTSLERVSKDKCSSLLGLIVSDEGKKFNNIYTWLEGRHNFQQNDKVQYAIKEYVIQNNHIQ
jgi:hypothetical protein